MAWLSAAKFFSCCLIMRASSSVWARWLIWSGAVRFSVEPDVWFWSVLQAVRTRGVLCVSSQDLERLFTIGSSGLQCSKAIPDRFSTLVSFVLFGSWFNGRNLGNWTVTVTWSFRWLGCPPCLLKWLHFHIGYCLCHGGVLKKTVSKAFESNTGFRTKQLDRSSVTSSFSKSSKGKLVSWIKTQVSLCGILVPIA